MVGYKQGTVEQEKAKLCVDGLRQEEHARQEQHLLRDDDVDEHAGANFVVVGIATKIDEGQQQVEGDGAHRDELGQGEGEIGGKSRLPMPSRRKVWKT